MKPLKSGTLNILGHEWELRVVKNPKMVKGRYGYCDRPNKTIWICSKDPIDEQYTTLLHELIHAVEDINDIKLTEHQVLIFEAGLYAVMHDNKIKFF